MTTPHDKPIIGLTASLEDGKAFVREAYLTAVVKAGGIPVILSPIAAQAKEVLRVCDAFIFTGGDDPDMSAFGESQHPSTTLIDSRRQEFELELLSVLDHHPDIPILGICLGMQMMGLHAGGKLNQYLPDTHETAEKHWNGHVHDIEGSLGTGSVYSHHRQALSSAGHFDVVAWASDDVIEAIRDPKSAHRIGVQWHPEKTTDSRFGDGLFTALIQAVSSTKTS